MLVVYLKFKVSTFDKINSEIDLNKFIVPRIPGTGAMSCVCQLVLASFGSVVVYLHVISLTHLKRFLSLIIML